MENINIEELITIAKNCDGFQKDDKWYCASNNTDFSNQERLQYLLYCVWYQGYREGLKENNETTKELS